MLALPKQHSAVGKKSHAKPMDIGPWLLDGAQRAWQEKQYHTKGIRS